MISSQTLASLLLTSLSMGIIFIAPIETASQIRPETPKTSEQSFNGKSAIDELKRSGGYESLEEAFKNASGMGIGDLEPANLLPGGNYEDAILTASDGQTSDDFGRAIAISSDTLVVGVPNDDNSKGAVYVFERTDATTWVFIQKLPTTRPYLDDGDNFGSSVDIHNDRIVVGASGQDSGMGAVHVFIRDYATENWVYQEELTASSRASGDKFGHSVAIYDEMIAVGAIGRTAFRGATFIFVFVPDGWVQIQQITPINGQSLQRFGYSLDLEESSLVVGAPIYDGWLGAAYVYLRNPSTGQMEFQWTLLASDHGGIAHFGESVSISGDTVAVGAPRKSSDRGAVYIFTRSGAVWTQQQKITAPTEFDAFNYFGNGVAVQGNTVVIGSPNTSSAGITRHGVVYVFGREGNIWIQTQRLTVNDKSEADMFGDKVGLTGDTIIAGVPTDDVGSVVNQGSVRVFQTKIFYSKILASDSVSIDRLGWSLSISGSTAVIGAPDHSGNRGAVYVFVRNGGVWSEQTKILGVAAGVRLGFDVGISGETMVVGAPGANTNRGAVFIYVRSSSSWSLQQRMDFPDASTDARLGWAVGISGNLVVAGAPLDDVPWTNSGSTIIYRRTGTTWNLEDRLFASDASPSDAFGNDVSISGGTIVVGVEKDQIGVKANQGSAWVFTYDGSNWTSIPPVKLTLSDGEAGDSFGSSVSIDGDFAVIGAVYRYVDGVDNRGAAYVFNRSAGVWTQSAQLTAPDGVQNDEFGRSVAISGDLIVVGTPSDRIGPPAQQGSAHVFERSGSEWVWQRRIYASDGLSSDSFGFAVAVNGSTIGVGAYGVDSPTDRGAGYLYYWGSLRATSAGASLSGRVLETGGRGLSNATVVLTDSMGVERTVQTGSFGRFSFSDLPSGETYILSVRSRRFVFAPQVVSLQSDLSDVRLEASGRSGR